MSSCLSLQWTVPPALAGRQCARSRVVSRMPTRLQGQSLPFHFVVCPDRPIGRGSSHLAGGAVACQRAFPSIDEALFAWAVLPQPQQLRRPVRCAHPRGTRLRCESDGDRHLAGQRNMGRTAREAGMSVRPWSCSIHIATGFSASPCGRSVGGRGMGATVAGAGTGAIEVRRKAYSIHRLTNARMAIRPSVANTPQTCAATTATASMRACQPMAIAIQPGCRRTNTWRTRTASVIWTHSALAR